MATNKPFIIGVCGNSGSGKSSLVAKIIDILGKKNVLVIHGDDYHKWPRGSEEYKKYTHLNPKANNLCLQQEQLSDLKNGNSVYKLKYDHTTGQLIGPFKTIPNKYIIIEGLHPFFSQGLRKNIDLKIYLDISPELSFHFKVHRDMKERGYSKEKVLEIIKKRDADYKKYMIPQRKYADLIIHKSPLIPLKADKEDTPIKFSFIHKRPLILTPLRKMFDQVCNKKFNHHTIRNHQTITTKKILNEQELIDLKKFAAKNFKINLSKDVYSICQLIIAYNLCYHGKKIGRLSYPHR